VGHSNQFIRQKNYIAALTGAGPSNVGLLYEPHLLPIWKSLGGFFIKKLEFDYCVPVVDISLTGITVHPATEQILDRLLKELEELNSLSEPKFRSRTLPDSKQICAKFDELLTRCAEPDDNRVKLNELPDRMKERMLYMVKEAGISFNPTLIRRRSWSGDALPIDESQPKVNLIGRKVNLDIQQSSVPIKVIKTQSKLEPKDESMEVIVISDDDDNFPSLDQLVVWFRQTYRQTYSDEDCVYRSDLFNEFIKKIRSYAI